MKRDYTEGSATGVTFFLGKEIEHTPAYGMKTLFIVGVPPIEEIEKLLADAFLSINEPVKHLFFGANQSYKPSTSEEWEAWDNMIEHFLKRSYFCTLDIPMDKVEGFHDGRLCEYDNFIPQISVKLPYIRLWNYNTMIKIDDKDFNATNPGVWTHSLHKLMDRNNFTSWNEYKGDTILK